MTKTMLIATALVACNPSSDHGEHTQSHPAKRPAADVGSNPDPHAEHGGTSAAPYDLRLSSAPPQPKVNTRLVFDPRGTDGARIERLAIVHEKPLHLLVVSRDLSFFAHEHPVREDAGTYAIDFAFPDAGDYVLFGDFTPEGARAQVVRIPVTVPGDAPAPKPLQVDDRSAPKRFGELTVSLGPPSIRAGADTMLAFTIDRDDEREIELRPYLGAMGHCVVIDETATTFLHSHPLQAKAGDPKNVVQFHTVFPAPAKYKVWGQFDVDGTMLIADFVVDVTPEDAASPSDPHAAHPH
jgi:hypothetical protein